MRPRTGIPTKVPGDAEAADGARRFEHPLQRPANNHVPALGESTLQWNSHDNPIIIQGELQ